MPPLRCSLSGVIAVAVLSAGCAVTPPAGVANPSGRTPSAATLPLPPGLGPSSPSPDSTSTSAGPVPATSAAGAPGSPGAGAAASPSEGPGDAATPTPTTSPQPQAPPPPAPPDCRQAKCIALTFDDGPGERTSELLDLLAREQVPATFFVMGRRIKDRPDVLRRMATMPGITLGNHTVTHPVLTRISRAQVRREIRANTRLIQRLTGVKPRLFRPPFGERNAFTDKVAGSLGQAVVTWSNDSIDWRLLNTRKVTARVVKRARPEAIVLMHDILPTTIDAVGPIIRKLRARGFVLVGLDQLLGDPRPGHVYWQQTR